MKILLVDDSRTIRTIQQNVLAQIAHTAAREAGDGLDAPLTPKEARPHPPLVDSTRPNLAGTPPAWRAPGAVRGRPEDAP